MKTPVRVLCFASLMTTFFACKTTQNSTSKTDETPIITVGNQNVSVDEFKYVYEKNSIHDSVAYNEQSLRTYIDLFVNYKLKVLDANQLGMDTTADFKAELEHYQQQLAKPYLTDNEISTKLVKESYQRLGEELRASHILALSSAMSSPEDTLKAYNKMLDVRKKAMAGEDFSKLAKTYSEDPSAAQNGGDIGYFTALQMVYQFEDMAYKTKINEISPVFRTKFGYHILKLTNKRKSSGPVKVAHILVRATEGISKEDSVAAANKIQQIYKQVQNGEDWNQTAEKYSDDVDTRNKGGELKWFSPGNMFPTFDEAAFALEKKGDISAPVKTIHGWHLIKLLDKKPLESFEAMEPILKRKISKDSRLEINKAFLITKLKKENKFIQSNKAMKLATSKADSTWLKNNWTYNKADADLNQVLFTINKEKFSLKNFYEYMEANPATTEAKKAKPIYYAQQKYQDYINKAVYDYQNAHLAEKVPEYRYLMNEYRDGTLMFKVMEQNVWTKALTDTAGLHKFFDEHRKNYQWKERAEATIYVCDSEKTLNLLKDELQKDYFENDVAKFDETKFAANSITIDSVQQDNLNKLVDFLQNDTISLVEIQGFVVKNEKNEFATKRMQAVKQFLISKGIAVNRIAEKNLGKMTAKKSGVKYAIYSKSNKALVAKMSKTNPLAVQLTEGIIQRGDNATLDQVPWEKGNFTLDSRFAYVIIKNIIPITDKKLSETKGAAVTDYQNYLETTWLDSLRKKYKVVINEEAFKKMIEK